MHNIDIKKMKFNSSEDELYNQVLSDVSVNVAYYSR